MEILENVTDYTGLPQPVREIKKRPLVEPLYLDLNGRVRMGCSLGSDQICHCGHFFVDHDISDLDDNGKITCELCAVLCTAYGNDQDCLSVTGGVDNWRKLPK